MTPPFEHLPAVGDLRASVVVLHGFRASARGQRHDGEAFLAPHVEVVMPDAPGHGARQDETLARLDRLDEARRRVAVLQLAQQWADELADLVASRREAGTARVALVGISMGGFAALARWAAKSSNVDAVASVLAGFDLVQGRGECPLLVGLAGRDESIPVGPAEASARAAGAELHVYPDSGHFMRGEDWHDLWRTTVRFVHRHVGIVDGGRPAPRYGGAEG